MDLKINKYTKKQIRNETLQTSETPASLIYNFKLLEKKLDYAQKQLSAWDFLKISQVIGNDDEYQVKINLLLPNTSAVVTKKLSNANPGDIFFRNTDYSVQRIQAERGGIYYPQIIQRTGGSTYQITYQFLPSEPTLETSETSAGATAEPAQQMIFTNISSSDPTSYAERKSPSSGSITFDTTINVNITPVFKSFTIQGEEVYWDLVYSVVNNKATINNIPSVIGYIIMR